MNRLDERLANETIQIEGDAYTFLELLSINQDNLSNEFATHASRFAYISALAAKAEALYNEAKQMREETYADVELWYREELGKLPDIKVTEGLIKSNVTTDDKYSNTVSDENQALHDWKLLKALVEGLRERGSMLISLGAHLRQEMDMTNASILATKNTLRGTRD